MGCNCRSKAPKQPIAIVVSVVAPLISAATIPGCVSRHESATFTSYLFNDRTSARLFADALKCRGFTPEFR